MKEMPYEDYRPDRGGCGVKQFDGYCACNQMSVWRIGYHGVFMTVWKIDPQPSPAGKFNQFP